MPKYVLALVLTVAVMLAGCGSAATDDDTPDLITVRAARGGFSPNVIKAEVGETLTLEVTAADTAHTLTVPDLGVDQTVSSGTTREVEIKLDKPGKFGFTCRFHPNMTGLIEVK